MYSNMFAKVNVFENNESMSIMNKNTQTLGSFKQRVKNLKIWNYLCSMNKDYINDVWYVGVPFW